MTQSLFAVRFHSQQPGAADYCPEVRVQQAWRGLRRLCGLHDPPGDPVQ